MKEQTMDDVTCGKAFRENRVRLFWVDEGDVLHLFRGLRGKVVALPVFADVPADVAILGVHHDWQHRCFAFVLAHDTFDPVPIGSRCPEPLGVARMHRERVKIERERPDPEERERRREALMRGDAPL